MHIEFYSTWMLVLMILRVMSSPTCLEKILIDACSSDLKSDVFSNMLGENINSGIN
jgi:hypothetical protein